MLHSLTLAERSIGELASPFRMSFAAASKHVKALDIRPLSTTESERYLADWKKVQSRFVDEPGQAIVDADRLIMDVMRSRAYPVSEFEQRAADISVTYPALVSNYRAARAIAIKNEQHQADTEELRQALIHYRSLFEELLKTESVADQPGLRQGTQLAREPVEAGR